MTFYDELRLAPSAAPDQIRQSYRRLALLLHPDQQQDPQLRELAECQMRRLNEIVAVLLDSRRRAEYDACLRAHGRAVALLPPTARGRDWPYLNLRAVAWVAAASLAVAGLAVLIGESGSVAERPLQAALSTVPEAREAPVKSARRLRRVLAPAQPDTEAVEAAEKSPPRAGYAPASAGYIAPPDIAPPDVRIPLPAVGRPAPPGISGAWFYSAPGPRSGQAAYPADYIEMVVAEEAGRITGRYRARYKVADRAISPNVVFEFGGERDRPLGWKSAAGAAGEMSLRLLSEDSLEVRWWATRSGSVTSLLSGTAVLKRRRDTSMESGPYWNAQ